MVMINLNNDYVYYIKIIESLYNLPETVGKYERDYDDIGNEYSFVSTMYDDFKVCDNPTKWLMCYVKIE